MDIAAQEFSHLEIVGATITMLLSGINGELKNLVEASTLAPILERARNPSTLLEASRCEYHSFRHAYLKCGRHRAGRPGKAGTNSRGMGLTRAPVRARERVPDVVES